MKKAKMFLAAVAMFGIVGGAFAFKASKFGSASYFTCSSTQTGQCNKQVFSTYNSLSASQSASFPNQINNARLASSTQTCSSTASCGTLYGSVAN